MCATNIKAILNRFYRTSPEGIYKLLQRLNNQRKVSKIVKHPAPYLNRQYFTRQNAAVLRLIAEIEGGASLDEVLKQEITTLFGERIVEYPYFFCWVSKKKAGTDILDVGCVLNNLCMKDILMQRRGSVWFCNPSIEKSIMISNPVYYHLSSLEDSFDNNQQFMLVTCLSTIEHIGFDNTQYGIQVPAKYTEPAVEPFISSFRKLASLTAPQGSLLISFPFGYREVLINPGTGKRASQVMNYDALQDCLPVLSDAGISYDLIVYAATENGWERVDPAGCHSRYANGRPGATAVALIDGKKKK